MEGPNEFPSDNEFRTRRSEQGPRQAWNDAGEEAAKNYAAGKLTETTAMEVLHGRAAKYEQVRNTLLSEVEKLIEGANGTPTYSSKNIEQGIIKAAEDESFSLADRGLLMEAVVVAPGLLKLASPELRNDKEVVLAALRGPQRDASGGYLKLSNCISERLLADPDVMTLLVQHDPGALFSASPEFRNNIKYQKLAVGAFPEIVEEHGEFRGNKELFLEAVKSNPETLKYASGELRNDKELVIAAVMQDGSALQLASYELRDDKDVARAALSRKSGGGGSSHYKTFSSLSRRLQQDRELCMLAAGNGYYMDSILEHNPDLARDKEFALFAIKNAHPATDRVHGPSVFAWDFGLLRDRDVALAFVEKGAYILSSLDQAPPELYAEIVLKKGQFPEYRIPDTARENIEIARIVLSKEPERLHQFADSVSADPEIQRIIREAQKTNLQEKLAEMQLADRWHERGRQLRQFIENLTP